MPNTLERTIFFYWLRCRQWGSKISLEAVFSQIESLPFTEDAGGRYFPKLDGNLWTMFVDSARYPIRARFGTIRRNALPLVEGRGRTSPLILPAKSQGLFEPTHFTIYANGILASEFNFYGPRISALRGYLPSVANGILEEVELLPLLRKDIQQTLAKVGEVRGMKIGVFRSIGNELSHLDPNLQDAFNSLKDTSDADSIEIVFRSERWSKNPISIPFKKKLASWLTSPGLKENIKTFVLKGRNLETGEMEDFDLMQNFILSTKRVVTQDKVHRSVDSEGMYEAIDEAYKENEAEISHSISKEDSKR